MKKRIALLLAVLLLCGAALADAPRLSDKLFAGAKQALLCLSTGDYKRLAKGLPFSGRAPTAKEWSRFAGNFSDLDDVQTEYAVAYWRNDGWSVAVPVEAPRNGSVEALILTSADGKIFNGYRYATWSRIQKEYRASDHVCWNEEYMGGDAMVMADGDD